MINHILDKNIERVLVCAPSNAAVDEICDRLKNGIPINNGTELYKPRIVRLGNTERINPKIHDVVLDTLICDPYNDDANKTELKSFQSSSTEHLETDAGVRAYTRATATPATDISVLDTPIENSYKMNDFDKQISGLESQLGKLILNSRDNSDDTNSKHDKKDSPAGKSEFDKLFNFEFEDSCSDSEYDSDSEASSSSDDEEEEEVDPYTTDAVAATSELLDVNEHNFTPIRTQAIKKIDKRSQKYFDQCKSIISNAEVVLCTLSGSGSSILQKSKVKFPIVVIDEAAQSTELSSIIPFQYSCNTCVMVGDPKQLPPTVFSRVATSKLFNESLFSRMFNNFPERHYLLDVQYRMHPTISKFPVMKFYQGKVHNAPLMKQVSHRFWHEGNFPHYTFFNVCGEEERSQKTYSYFNKKEAEQMLWWYQDLHRTTKDKISNLPDLVGIITPYREQLFYLRRYFTAKLGKEVANRITFRTIDGFQGQEKEIIFLSCVRGSGMTKTVGFLEDERRLNVGITRAKNSLWVFGNSEALSRKSGLWKHLIGDAKSRKLYVDLEKNRSSSSNDTTESNIDSKAILKKDSKSKKKKGKKGKKTKKKEGEVQYYDQNSGTLIYNRNTITQGLTPLKHHNSKYADTVLVKKRDKKRGKKSNKQLFETPPQKVLDELIYKSPNPNDELSKKERTKEKRRKRREAKKLLAKIYMF